MKQFIFSAFFTLVASVWAHAQSETPRADVREATQQARIREGRTSGELTQGETVLLKKEQRRIRRSERRAEADGTVNTREKARLERKQDRANRHIKRAKHNSVKN